MQIYGEGFENTTLDRSNTFDPYIFMKGHPSEVFSYLPKAPRGVNPTFTRAAARDSQKNGARKKKAPRKSIRGAVVISLLYFIMVKGNTIIAYRNALNEKWVRAF
ncbi:MAG: hypothetical protein ACI8YQ_000734 [Polaribacter sp.]|jgi:hypothetical protein